MDGKKVKSGHFVRSANLSQASRGDAEMLYDFFNVRRVIDLRRPAEALRTLDNEIPHVAYIQFPLQKASPEDDGSIKKMMEVLKGLDNDTERAALIPDLKFFYAGFLKDDFARTNLRTLIQILLTNDYGATLYHCSSGKDRVGMTTATLLTVLGVSREEIYKDYLKSIPSATYEANWMVDLARKQGFGDEVAAAIYRFMLPRPDLLDAFFAEADKQYGDADGFIKGFLRFDEGDLKYIRMKYLE